jgi:hypothetical protein
MKTLALIVMDVVGTSASLVLFEDPINFMVMSILVLLLIDSRGGGGRYA